jgi:nitroreductase
MSDYSMVRTYPKELDPRSRKVGAELYAVMGIDRDDAVGRDDQTASNYKFFGAPVEIFFFAHKRLGVYSVSDVSFFAQNLMLSAQARGLGTCAQGSVALWSKAVRREFKVPRHYKLAYGLAIGYASDHPLNSYGAERLPIAAILVDGV